MAGYMRLHPRMPFESVALKSRSAEVDVAQGASPVELWFKSTDNRGCVGWNGCYGQNYWLVIAAA